MPKVRVVIDNKINVYNPPPALSKGVKKELTFPNPAYDDAINFNRTTRGIPKNIRLYEEFNGVLSIPRGSWGSFSNILNELGYQIDVVNNTLLFEPTYPPKEMQLWDYQQPWIEKVLNSTQGIGVAPPGSGKTAMFLYVYSKLGQPCLWLTHTQRLAHQAAESAKNFLGIESGIIGGGKEDIKHFTVGMIPTLARKSEEELKVYASKFGMVITDECHHIPAVSSFKVLSAFNARYRYGATATPYREDRLEKIIFDCIGPQLAYLDKEDLRAMGKLMTPSVVRKYTDFYFPYDPSSRKHNYAKLVDAIGEDFRRNKQIATDVIVESTIEDNNVCIVLVGRIPHGEKLLEMIQPVIPECGFVHSNMKRSEGSQILDDFGNGKLRILIATYKMLAEGFDYQPSNRLFLTAPFKGRSLIEQACGRIERAFPGKTSAIVFDYVDVKIGVLTRQAETRLDIYEMNNNPVSTLK